MNCDGFCKPEVFPWILLAADFASLGLLCAVQEMGWIPRCLAGAAMAAIGLMTVIVVVLTYAGAIG